MPGELTIKLHGFQLFRKLMPLNLYFERFSFLVGELIKSEGQLSKILFLILQEHYIAELLKLSSAEDYVE